MTRSLRTPTLPAAPPCLQAWGPIRAASILDLD